MTSSRQPPTVRQPPASDKQPVSLIQWAAALLALGIIALSVGLFVRFGALTFHLRPNGWALLSLLCIVTLYIARLMAEGMGGTLTLAHTQEGKGSEFQLILPVAPANP